MIQRAKTNTLVYDQERCIGCGMCSVVCPHAVFVVDEAKPGMMRPTSRLARARPSALTITPDAVLVGTRSVAKLVRPEACMECGACQRNCPTEAIRVEAGVGCAAALMRAALTGKGEETCGCGGSASSCRR